MDSTQYNSRVSADVATDLHALRRRRYASQRESFNRADAFEGVASDPLHLHKYNYTGGNAVNSIDPSGQDWSLVGKLAVAGVKGLLMGAAIGAVGGAATGAYLHIVHFQTFQGVLGAAGKGALYGAIAGAIIGASTVNPTLLATTLSISFGVSVRESIPILTDSQIPVRTKVAIIFLLALQGTLSRGAIAGGFGRPVRPSSTFAADLQQSFNSQVGGAVDNFLGGYITAEGKPVLLPFTRNGIPDHATGVSLGVIPANARGGFSVVVDSQGRATHVLFRSALNLSEEGGYLPVELQQQVINGLPKAPNFKVLE